MLIRRIECRREKKDSKKILGQYDRPVNTARYEAGLETDSKLTKLRATLILSVHPTTVSYTKSFPAAAAAYSSS